MSGVHRPALPTLEHCVESIETAYRRLGHEIGWRFLAGPRRTFTTSTRFALVTLNPGGTHEDPAHPRASSENGSAYWIESWKGYPVGTAPLQIQVQQLFASIGRIVGSKDSAREFVESQVLIAHLIPFRSRNLKSLHRPQESFAFARELWSDILAAWTPRVIMTISKDAFDNLRRVLATRLHAGDTEPFPTGHRNRAARTAEACRFWTPEGKPSVTLARLPHLSRFPLFSIEVCRQPVEEFLDHCVCPRPPTGTMTTSLPVRRPTVSIKTGGGPPQHRTPPAVDAHGPRAVALDSRQRVKAGLRGIDGAGLYPEWEGHIADRQVRAAFHLLVDLAAASPQLVLSFKRKGVLKTCRLHYRSGGRRTLPYSFIVNKSWLKFYFRLPEVRRGRGRLRRDFDSFDDSNSKGEWTIKLRTENDVRLLLQHVGQLGGTLTSPTGTPPANGEASG